LPGAPLFCWATRYASWSVSCLQTWTYKPQNRQAGSAFALRYILRLRSCSLIGAFVISLLPSMLSENYSTVRSLRSAGISLRLRSYEPLRHPLLFARFPGVTGYTAYLAPRISTWEEEGFSSCWAYPCHRAAAPTPPESDSVSATLRCRLLPSPSSLRVRPPGLLTFGATSAFACAAAR